VGPTKQEYQQMCAKASPPGKHLARFGCAFGVGGAICALGQACLQLYRGLGAAPDTAAALTSVTLVALSALLTGFKVYDNLARFAGAGTLVPITGFANAVVSPAMEFRAEGMVLGVGARMFAIAGPVIVYGTVASALYGLLYDLLNRI